MAFWPPTSSLSVERDFINYRIQDLTIDFCQDALILIDSGSLLRLKLENGKNHIFENWNTDEKQAQLISTHSNELLYLSENNEILHRDGFSLKLKNGLKLCSTNEDKSFNIRSIQIYKNSLFLLDAHNLIIWRLDLKNHPWNNEICDLEIWKRLESSKQPRDFALLHSPQECISTTTILETTTSISAKGKNK